MSVCFLHILEHIGLLSGASEKQILYLALVSSVVFNISPLALAALLAYDRSGQWSLTPCVGVTTEKRHLK